ncbi:MAG TPA: SHOCT domain-containing protein [Caldithrix abyssi]|uniref:SHOCT domain-containing protein n=1 Tax=Caldithrix abyssi TaxID=187145 RepID=A0A7V5H5G5_CALAY|nr:SHOCT domain-containing protein [Caldithrix abyssi]
MMGFGMGFGWIISLILIAVGIWFVIRLNQNQNNKGDSLDQDPLEIVKNRYARGEISKAEFERMKNDLLT